MARKARCVRAFSAYASLLPLLRQLKKLGGKLWSGKGQEKGGVRWGVEGYQGGVWVKGSKGGGEAF